MQRTCWFPIASEVSLKDGHEEPSTTENTDNTDKTDKTKLLLLAE